MSVLVVGISHASAPVELLERVAVDRTALPVLLGDVAATEHVSEALVLATCNRVELYAGVERFHGSVEALTGILAGRAGVPAESLVPHLYVHYDDGAVGHLFQVAAGLDSMVVGEGQILGQAREALRVGQAEGTVGPSLNALFQQALRVGKRGHAETDIDHATPSLVGVTLERAAAWVDGLEGRRVVVVGAGSMAALAVATATREGASVMIGNRTRDNADRLAATHGARAFDMTDLAEAVVEADVVISCTGATGTVLEPGHLAGRDGARRVAVVDLALPHDVDPRVAQLPGVDLVSLADLARERPEEGAGVGDAGAEDVARVRKIVAEETDAFLAARRAAAVTPTVVALRSMAGEVVEAEMTRLTSRLPDLDEVQVDEVRRTVQRTVDKLLHGPTVRVRELEDTGSVTYATALAQLFALDPDAVQAVTKAEGGAR
ncbi:glutamyl-tRNA reductase [Nocardioidaceae bacterium]|nr:glutamyl-tRNA reductase [Nocardioidaceae bacterium]